jgi:hypothetical protein
MFSNYDLENKLLNYPLQVLWYRGTLGSTLVQGDAYVIM